MPNTANKNMKITGNAQNCFKILILALALPSCNSATLESNAHHYQTRTIQVMHVTRDISFGDEHNTYSKLYQEWRRENAEQRQQAYYQKCLSNLKAHRPVQILFPNRSNHPAAASQASAAEMAAALPLGTL